MWQGVGTIPWVVACRYLQQADSPNFSCDWVTISGDSSVPDFILTTYPFIIGIIGAWMAIKLLHRKDLTQVITGRPSFDYSRVLFAIWVSLVLYSGWFLANLFLLGGELEFRSPNPWEYVTFFLFAIVLIPYQAGFEEIFFRGYILQGLTGFSRNRGFLVALSALLFVLPHMANPEPWAYGFFPYALSLFLFGTFVTAVTLVDGGIELAVGYHALNNLFLSLVASTEVSVLQTPSLFVIPLEGYRLFPDILVEVVLYGLMFLAFNYRYRWTRWPGRRLQERG